MTAVAFGPVPSRRLGRSLGVTTVPIKTCSYSCVYCQAGRTRHLETERRAYESPPAVAAAVAARLEALADGGRPDYLTLIADGEPTLDARLGETIERLRPVGVKIAVITNASLVWRPDVRRDLAAADCVSLKVDTTRETVWRRLNRPAPALALPAILDGALEFSLAYHGRLLTETMIVEGLNDTDDGVWEVAEFVRRLAPECAYLSVPTRPPAEPDASPPPRTRLERLQRVMHDEVARVECLDAPEQGSFGSTGHPTRDILGATRVHPMRESSLRQLLARAGADWSPVERLVKRRLLVVLSYRGTRFYMARPAPLPRWRSRS